MKKSFGFLSLVALTFAFGASAEFQDFPGNPGGGPIIIEPQPGGGDGPIISEVERTVFHCSSSRYRYAECYVPGYIIHARVVRRASSARCVEGQSYGFYGDTVWVDRGCRADFEVFFKHPEFDFQNEGDGGFEFLELN